MGGPQIKQQMWLAFTVLSLTASLALAKDCPSTLKFWELRKYCCDNGALGCYSNFPVTPCCYDDRDVKYLLFTPTNRDTAARLYLKNGVPPAFVAEHMTVFLIHGWNSDSDTMDSIFLKMKNALLDKGAVNVVVVDWPSHRTNYYLSASETQTVGALTGLVMDVLVGAGSMPQDIWCAGHSLGAHVCGFAGRATAQKIGRVTGLDPAGPWFSGAYGLNTQSAQFVDVIHTDTKGTLTLDLLHLGTMEAVGHMDFFVNGLDEQPGCLDRRRGLEEQPGYLDRRRRGLEQHPGYLGRRRRGGNISCSHSRANEYFLETIKNENCFFSTIQCPDVDSLENVPSSCAPCASGGMCAVMGYAATHTTDGIYYVQPSDTPQYCTPPL